MELKLVALPAAFGMRSVSPFCLKIEMLLTSLGLPFEIREEADPRKAPKGKLPFLAIDGDVIGDSELIAERLDERTSGQVYGSLTEAQKGIGFSAVRLAEEHLYWILVASRWLDDGWWPHVVDGFFSDLPPVVRTVVPVIARREVRRTYHLQGLGRHTPEEQRGFAHRDLAALGALVGSSGFLVSDDEACVFDFAVAATLAGIYDQQPGTWLTPIANEYPDLKSYTERVQEKVGVFGRPV